MADLKDNVALVTGASRGIGASIADRLGEAGATVVGTATTDEGADGISQRFKAAEITGRGMALDVTDADSIQSTIAAIGKEYGPVSILVNNAGIARDQLLMRMKEEDWDSVLDTNLKSVYRVSKGVLRGMMKARGGRIINIASVVASTGNPGQGNYAAAKSGIIGFSKSLAREVGSRNITVNVVAPGFIDTDMTRALEESQRETLLSQVPLARFGDRRDVANAVAFLASAQAAYITGETLHVNGGMYMS